MKKKLIVAAVVFTAAIFVNVYFSTIVFQLISGSFMGAANLSFTGGVKSILKNSSHRTIFCCIQIFAALGLILLITSRMASTQGKMIRVTKDIKTPAVAGQKQHGSARWQSKKEIFMNFDTVILSKNNPVIKDLIKHGYDDLEFYKRERGDADVE